MILELPCVFPRHLGDVPKLAASFPGLTIVIDHLAKPPLGSAEMGVWATELHGAASSPNVFAKISGLNTMLAHSDWNATDLRDAVAVAVDAFGPERLVCGSDWPVALLNGDYEKVVAGDRPSRQRRRSRRSRKAPGRERPASLPVRRRRRFGVQEARHGSADRSGDRGDQEPDHVGRVRGWLPPAEGAGPRAEARPLAQLPPRGRPRPDADRRARAAGRRRHVRDEPRARVAPDGDGVHQRLADGIDPPRAAPGAPHPRAGGNRAGCHATGRKRLRSAPRLPRRHGGSRDDAGLHRSRRGVPSHHRDGVWQLDLGLADPEPVGRDTARPPLALGHGERRNRGDQAPPLGHLPRASRPGRQTCERGGSDPPLRRASSGSVT